MDQCISREAWALGLLWVLSMIARETLDPLHELMPGASQEAACAIPCVELHSAAKDRWDCSARAETAVHAAGQDESREQVRPGGGKQTAYLRLAYEQTGALLRCGRCRATSLLLDYDTKDRVSSYIDREELTVAAVYWISCVVKHP